MIYQPNKIKLILITFYFLLTSFIFSFLGCENNSQSGDYFQYNFLSNKADLHYVDQEYQKALDYYQLAFKHRSDESYHLFRSAVCALKTGNDNLGFQLIRRAISDGGANLNYLKSFPDLKGFHSNPEWDEIVDNFPKLRKEYFFKMESIDYYVAVSKLIERDQLTRNIVLGNSLADSLLQVKTSELDSINIDELIKLTKQYGWNSRGWLILWHQRSSFGEENYIWNYFKPVIDEAIVLNKESPDFWARFVDNSYFYKEGKQYYGTLIQSKIEGNRAVQYISALINPEEVDKKRSEIGLCSIADYCKKYNIKLPINYPLDEK